jgi:hypothetical protein
MTHDPRPHIHRRGHAIGRLRFLTTGAAVAGIAGTAGFGVLAAASWSGASTPDATVAPTTTTDDDANAQAAPRIDGPQVIPGTGDGAQQPVTAPRVQRGAGPGHAATGGSG